MGPGLPASGVARVGWPPRSADAPQAGGRGGLPDVARRLAVLIATKEGHVTLTSWDDFPVHQAPEFIAHVGTSDRNFYDRYYFHMHAQSDAWFAIFGFGKYPNLGVVDAFIDVRRGDEQHVVRASKPLTDR